MSYDTARNGFLSTKEKYTLLKFIYYLHCYSIMSVIDSSQQKIVDVSQRKEELEKAHVECNGWNISSITDSLKPSEKLRRFVLFIKVSNKSLNFSLLDAELLKEEKLKEVTSKVIVELMFLFVILFYF